MCWRGRSKCCINAKGIALPIGLKYKCNEGEMISLWEVLRMV